MLGFVRFLLGVKLLLSLGIIYKIITPNTIYKTIKLIIIYICSITSFKLTVRC